MRVPLSVVLLLATCGSTCAGLEIADVEGKTVEACELVRERHPDDLFSYLCYYLAARTHGQRPQAMARLDSLLELRPGEPRIQLYLGLLAAEAGQSRAERLFREAIDGFVRDDEKRGEVWARISLSVNLQYRGRLDEAAGELAAAERVAAAWGDPVLLGEVRLNLGSLAQRRSEFGPAWTHLRSAEQLIVPDGPVYLRARLYLGLAEAAWELGNFSEAYRYNVESLEVIGESDPRVAAEVRSRIALAGDRLALTGELDSQRARRLAEEALETALAAHAPGPEVTARLLLAQPPEGYDFDPDLVRQAEVGLEKARELGRREDEIWALGLLAEAWAYEDGERALELVEQIEGLARELGNPERLARAMNIRTVVLMNLGRQREAIEAGLEALDRIERIRDLQQDEQIRARVFGRFAYAYRRLAVYLFEAGGPEHVELAFRVTERLRARGLLDMLDAGRLAETLVPDDPRAGRHRQVLEEIARIQRRLLDGTLDPKTRDDLLFRLEGLELDESALRHSMAEIASSYAQVRTPSIADLKDVQLALAPDQAMVSYLIRQVEGFRAWALVVTRESAEAVPLEIIGPLHREVTTYLSLIERRDGVDRAGSARLYRLLIEPALELLPTHVRRLIVVPDGSLHRLPFAALVDGAGTPLIAGREISVAPSASIWLGFKTRPVPEASAPLIALADPELPEPASAASIVPDRDFRLFDGVAGAPALPHARREVRTMERMLGGGGRVLVGRDATERALKRADLAAYRVVHLAAHAVVDERRPERSAVLLAAGSDREDGLLQFREIVDLDLDGRIVILASCRSASGPLFGGDGVMGLARAFFLAGSSTVVAGLWPLRDDEVALLIDGVARGLSRGDSVAAALASAQRILIERGAPPAAWAGLVVLGDGDQRAVTGERPRSSTVLPWVVVVAALVGWGLWRRYRV